MLSFGSEKLEVGSYFLNKKEQPEEAPFYFF